ncbi:MAG: AMP-binding protein, partial [bacterium]|nr:AMP-binding protein [bacterium]
MTTRILTSKAKAASKQNIKEKNYWTAKLEGEREKNYFPYDYKKEADTNNSKRAEFATQGIDISGPVNSKLMALTKGNEHVIHIYLTAILAMLLDKYTYGGGREILLGTPVYKQQQEGEYINTVLPVKLRWTARTIIKELLRQVKEVLTEAVEHRNFPVEMLPAALGVPYRENEDFPLFDVTIVMEGIHKKEYLEHIRHNMTFVFRKERENLEGDVEYNPGLYAETTIRRIGNHMGKVLQDVLENLEAVAVQLEVLTREEKEWQIRELNNEDVEYPAGKTIDMIFDGQVRKNPENIAIANGQTGEGRALTYGELNKKVADIAAILIQKGVKTGDIVGIMTNRTIDTVVGIQAILKAGAAYLPMDADYPLERIEYMLKDSNTGLLLVDDKSEIRISKYETKTNDQNSNHRNQMSDLMVLNFEHLDLGFVSDFEFRASDLAINSSG